MKNQILIELETRMEKAAQRWGPFASTLEALGVAMEEWDEFREAVRSNNLTAISDEALDLAAALVRLAYNIQDSQALRERSAK